MNKFKRADEEILTGNTHYPVTFHVIEERVKKLKNNNAQLQQYRKKGNPNSEKIVLNQTVDAETDIVSTNFWPKKIRAPSAMKAASRNLAQRKARPLSQYKKVKVTNDKVPYMSSKQIISNQGLLITFKKQLLFFQKLYDALSSVLQSIKQGLFQLQKAISAYQQVVLQPNMTFIDDFIEGKDEKLRKVIRTSRLQQCLSIAYLFLQIAQQRMQNNESYLVNFIGHCLSNLILIVRVYILKIGRPQFQQTDFQKEIVKFQTQSFGYRLTKIQEVLLRMQHNNQIILMMHKKLGRFNPKFQQCIKMFLKAADRKRQTCLQCTHYIFQYLAMHIHESQLIGISESLEIAPTPYLPPAQKEYTLIIEPLGVLTAGNKIRPFLTQFMKWASKHFQVVLWSWEMPVQIQDICEVLNPYITTKLYRYHCKMENQIYTKDLTRLGRKLDKTIIVDYDKRIFKGFQHNGIECRYKGDSKDKGLLVVCQIFQEMLNSNSSVPDTLRFYAEQLHSVRGY